MIANTYGLHYDQLGSNKNKIKNIFSQGDFFFYLRPSY